MGRSGDGKRNILWGWPKTEIKIVANPGFEQPGPVL